MSRESALLTKVLRQGTFRVILSQKITRYSFRSPIHQMVFGYIDDHFHRMETRGQVPTIESVREKYPEFVPEDSDAPLETLCTELRESRLKESLTNLLIDTQSLAEVQPAKALEKLRHGIFSMAKDMEVSELGSLANLDDVKEDYYRAKASGGVVGIPFPWEGLTVASGGMLPNDLVVFYGRNKSMKSWLLMFIASHAFFSNYRVLFVSVELSMLMVKRRLAAIIAGIDYNRFRQGSLSTEEERDAMLIFDTVLSEEDGLGNGGSDLMIMPTEDQGINQISQKIDELRPDLVCIDSIYMLASPGWKEQTALIKSVKSMAKDQQIPIVVTTQANRSKDKEDKTSRIGFADSYAQIADYLLHVEKVLTTHEGRRDTDLLPSIFVEVAAAREFQMEGFRLDVLPATYCKEVEVYSTTKELERAKDEAKSGQEQDAPANYLTAQAGWTEAQ